MAYMVDKNVTGAVNGASEGTISLGEILKYIEKRTKKRAILEADGDVAPYNGDPEFNINSDKAKSLGFMFTDIHDWIYDLLDYYIYETFVAEAGIRQNTLQIKARENCGD